MRMQSRWAGGFRRIVPLVALAVFSLGCDDDDGGLAGPGPDPAVTFSQADRFGLPAINTVFIPSAQKQTYNMAAPRNDQAEYRDEVVGTLTALGIDMGTANAIADAVLPDILPIDTSLPTAFLNGRAPSDDVITAELMLIFGGNAALNDDHVDANDRAFAAAFPYLAGAN